MSNSRRERLVIGENDQAPLQTQKEQVEIEAKKQVGRVSGWRVTLENKRVGDSFFFFFSPRVLLSSRFIGLFQYLLPFFGQLHNFTIMKLFIILHNFFPKLFIILNKELFHVPFTVF